MQRRSFIYQSGLMGVALASPGILISGNKKSNYKLGYQLYSVNEDMNNDPIHTLKRLKAMGYQDFEIYGFDPDQIAYYGYKATDFKQILDELDLTVTSGHYRFSDYFTDSDEQLKRFVDQCIQGASILGSPYITWPWLAPEFRSMENYKIMADKLNRIGEQINQAGFGFAYHNHGFEFEYHNGQTGYNVIIEQTDPELVKLQLDMDWVMHSSDTTPKALIEKQPGRYVMWHIKDMDKITRDYTELGNGSIDYTQILPDPEYSGLEYFYIEQGGNFTHSAIQSAETSATYFKKHLRKFL